MAGVMLQNVDDVYPLTSMQQGMLYHTLSDPEPGVYVNQIVTPISGDLDVARFQRAWNDVVERHPTLRTAFLWEGLDDPLQVVRSHVDTDWRELDLSAMAGSEKEARLDEFLDDDRRRGFDLAQAPLSRMMLAHLGPEEWRWVWSFHHLIVDGWSANLLLDELFGIYEGAGIDGVALSDPPRYRDFVADHLARNRTDEEAFWKAKLAGFMEPHHLDVPGLPPDSDASGYRTDTVELDVATSQLLRDAARELNVTLNTVFVGMWALVLSRWTRSTDVVFGGTVAGRPSSLPGVEHATGLFINTLPQRVRVSPGQRLGAWLRDVQRGQIETLEHEQTSLASIQRWSEVETGRPLFDSILVFENYPRRHRSNRYDGIEVGERTYIEQSNYPLAVLVIPGDSIRISIVYDTTRFSDGAIENLGDQLRGLAAAVAARPHDNLTGFGLATAEQQAWMTRVGEGPALAEDGRTIHDIIREAAEARPKATAVVDETGSMSYQELLQRSGRIADRLAAVGVGPNRLVGLYLPRSADMIVGMLGILEAGGAYVPLDPAYPPAHLRELLAGDEVEFVLTSSSLDAQIPDHVTRVLIDGEPVPADRVTRSTVSSADLAYVIHTSGSTGRPKGVMVTHANLVHSTRARNVTYQDPVGTFMLLSSFAFDSSVAGIFWTLTTGGTLVLPESRAEQDVDSLLRLAREREVTHTLCLPSLYEVLLEHADEAQLAGLQVAIVAGEACPPRILEAHRARLPHTELYNEYGPTEATVWCTVHRATASDAALPIGRAIAGARIYLMDEYGHLAPPGFVGEICIGGAGVVPGYLHRPDLTAERFVELVIDGSRQRLYRTGDLGAFRPDGALLYLGRLDTQLKVRGHRIEPSAVEAALRGQPGVGDAAVAGRRSGRGSSAQLVAFVQPAGDPVDVGDLRSALGAELPAHMVPDRVVQLAELPRLPNGKVSYRDLPDGTSTTTDDFVPPQTDEEAAMAALWADMLEVEGDAVGSNSDFFDLGGHSLIAIRLMAAVRKRYGSHLPLSALLDAPKLSEFTRLAENGHTESSNLVPMQAEGDATAYLIHPGGGNVLVYQPLVSHLPDSIRTVLIQAHGVDGVAEPDRTVEEMAQRYATEIEAYDSAGPANLVGYSTGGTVAFETARVIEARGGRVGLLVLLDTGFPRRETWRVRIARDLETLARGTRADAGTVVHSWWRSLRTLLGKLRHGPKWTYLIVRGRPLPPALAGKRINHIALSANRAYQPGEYGGTITYVRATGESDSRHEEIRGWKSVAADVVVRDAPGMHMGPNSLVSEPNAGAVASILADLLEAET